MPRKKKVTLRPIDYLDALNQTVAHLKDMGETDLKLDRFELDMTSDAAETGLSLKAVAEYIYTTRRETVFGQMDSRDVLGDETINPAEVAA